MSDVAEAFARCLAAEREAALKADFDALVLIQEEKRTLLPLLKQSADPAVVEELSDRARKNLRLLRQLVMCVQGMLGVPAENTYTAQGQSQQRHEVTQLTVRGRL
ncbi:MAG: hypothetical protein ABW321_09260 [Polyangiales bacterium]